ncbi:hypothetical protein L208DRAFT_1304308, partial [Tricholoma matsutake]
SFPPPPLTDKLSHTVVSGFCAEVSPAILQEAGCSVCGRLMPGGKLSSLKAIKNQLHVLEAEGVTRTERRSNKEAIQSIKGPVLASNCDHVCDTCCKHLWIGNVPWNALAKGLWVGDVPEELSSLWYIEKLLVQHVHMNGCFVHVASSGMRKMVAHAIAFDSPVAKVYHSLPPPIEDLDEVLAVLFTGPCKPTSSEYKHTPLLVHRKAVSHALEWLKVNHQDYSDLNIAYESHHMI